MIGIGILILLACLAVAFIALRPRRDGNPWRDGWLDHLKSEAPELLPKRTGRKL